MDQGSSGSIVAILERVDGLELRMSGGCLGNGREVVGAGEVEHVLEEPLKRRLGEPVSNLCWGKTRKLSEPTAHSHRGASCASAWRSCWPALATVRNQLPRQLTTGTYKYGRVEARGSALRAARSWCF